MTVSAYYLIDTILPDGTLIDTIALVSDREQAREIVAECVRERDDAPGAIIGSLRTRTLSPREALLHCGHQIPETWTDGDVASYIAATDWTPGS